jgi:hypothetical protein
MFGLNLAFGQVDEKKNKVKTDGGTISLWIIIKTGI